MSFFGLVGGKGLEFMNLKNNEGLYLDRWIYSSY